MELNEAIQHLISSQVFKDKAKQKNAEGGKYRMFLTRHKKGDLKAGAAFDFLLHHGYSIEVLPPQE